MMPDNTQIGQKRLSGLRVKTVNGKDYTTGRVLKLIVLHFFTIR
jgi:hypothetical protein